MLTNRLGLPKPFAEAVDDGRHQKNENAISATQIMKGVAEIVLTRRHADEIYEDVADRVWAILGTAVHKILEESQESETQIKEGFLHHQIDGTRFELTGIFDLYDDKTGTVTDYKTATVTKWQRQEFEDYWLQTAIYCWLLRKAGFAARRGEIVMILRDWMKSKARFEKGYPDCQVQKIEFEFDDAHIEWVGEWIADKASAIEAAEAMPDESLGPCTPSERWARPDTWAVIKEGSKKAYRVKRSREEAEEIAVFMGDAYRVEHRPGEDAKCIGYCAVREWCSYGRGIASCGESV